MDSKCFGAFTACFCEKIKLFTLHSVLLFSLFKTDHLNCTFHAFCRVVYAQPRLLAAAAKLNINELIKPEQLVILMCWSK